MSLLQDVCIALEVTDAMQLPGALRSLLQAVATIPKLERFVGDVCEVICDCCCILLPPPPPSNTCMHLGGCEDHLWCCQH